MAGKNILYAQSGGVTAVINATACGVIESARKSRRLGKVYAGKNGIMGVLREELIDTSLEDRKAISNLRQTPSGAFGSCRYKLKTPEESRAEYERLIDVFRAHEIGYFFYNGGGDSQDTANKVSEVSLAMDYPVTCIGIPKTVDNDLPLTDFCPGFGSVAKYVAVSTLEASFDVISMAESSTRVFVLEVMGRHAGWIAAAGGLAGHGRAQAPHIILFPEIPFNQQDFLARVEQSVQRYGHCVVVASEGAQYADGTFIADAGGKDAFGHTQLGGVAPTLVEMIKIQYGFKCHWSVADYLQRAARHIASSIDVEMAYQVGAKAVEFALEGRNAVMPIITRTVNKRGAVTWGIKDAPLSSIANIERKMPRNFISKDGYGITAKARAYLTPLIEGEDYPEFENGLPKYSRLKNQLLKPKLPPFDI